MRVRRPQTGRKRRTLDEQETYPRANSPQAARGGPKTSRRGANPRARKAAWDQRGNLPPLDKSVRWHEGRRHEASKGAGEGELPPQEDSRRSSGGHPDPKGGEPGKLLTSPTRRKAAVERVRRELKVSERRACRVIGQHRSSQRYAGRKAE